MDIDVSFPAQGRIQFRSKSLFYDSNDEHCRSFVERLLSAEQVRSVTVDRRNSGLRLPTARKGFRISKLWRSSTVACAMAMQTGTGAAMPTGTATAMPTVMARTAVTVPMVVTLPMVVTANGLRTVRCRTAVADATPLNSEVRKARIGEVVVDGGGGADPSATAIASNCVLTHVAWFASFGMATWSRPGKLRTRFAGGCV